MDAYGATFLSIDIVLVVLQREKVRPRSTALDSRKVMKSRVESNAEQTSEKVL